MNYYLLCLLLQYIFVCDALKCYDCERFGKGEVDCADKECKGGKWCTASIVRDRSTGTTSIRKSCAKEHIGGDSADSCLRVQMDSVESVTCSCQHSNLCNSKKYLQVLQKKHVIEILRSQGSYISCPVCHKSNVGTDCDVQSQCSGEWCIASVVIDRNRNTSTLSKGCSKTGPGLTQEYCSIAKGQDKLDTITCVCNATSFCTGEHSLQKLLKRTLGYELHAIPYESEAHSKSYNDASRRQTEINRRPPPGFAQPAAASVITVRDNVESGTTLNRSTSFTQSCMPCFLFGAIFIHIYSSFMLR